MTEFSQPASAGTPEVCLPPHLRKPRLRRWEASEYLELVHGIQQSPATLAKKASTGGGPPYHKSVRSPLYPRDELDRWAVAYMGGLVRHSSDTGAAA
ncbi:hypothetical protein EDC65_3596 [Stella humosa]|uniref:AlpA family transcriptional regulator n=1 Tax=Stella humosa TaxID=94 RepID=A0A3N1KYL2_9PROT|nr:hypothetical protein [Stella humosa]ROP84247.1 hypothetical protein EDC65_3596 [Stella humosa]BBK33760.1 hypothetical protein STHU_43940 [Stella humosa]